MLESAGLGPWAEKEREGATEKLEGTLDWTWKRENPDGNSCMKFGCRENGQEKSSPVLFLFLPVFLVFFSVPVFSVETVHGRFIRETVPVGTGFSHPVFIPSYMVVVDVINLSSLPADSPGCAPSGHLMFIFEIIKSIVS